MNKEERLKEITRILSEDKKLNPAYYFKPFDYQLPFFQSNARIRLIEGGNQSGKTTCALVEAIYLAKGESPFRKIPFSPPIKVRILANDFQKAIEETIHPTLANFLSKHDIKYAKRNPLGVVTKIVLRNDSVIDFMSYEQPPTLFEGWVGKVAIFDEPPPREVFIPTLRGLLRGGCCILSFTPVVDIKKQVSRERLAWIYDELHLKAAMNGGDDNDIETFTWETYQNLVLNRESIDSFAKRLDEEEYSSRILGRWPFLSGIIFTEFNSKLHVIDGFDVHNDNFTKYLGIDPHSTARTTALFVAVDRDENFYIYDEYGQENVIIPYFVEDVKKRLGSDIPIKIVIDPSASERNPVTNISYLDEYRKHFRRPIVPAKKDLRDVGFSRIKQLLKDGKLFIFKHCSHLIKEISRFRNYAEDEDHSIDCLRYILSVNPRYVDKERERTEIERSFDPLYHSIRERSIWRQTTLH